MAALEFLKTPGQKAEHVGINFGYNSLYARSMRLLARIAGEHPSEKKLSDALDIVEQEVEEYLQLFRHQP